MSFFVGQKVASVKNASKIGVVLELGMPNEKGVRWVRIRYGKTGQGKWTLEDGIRPYQSSRSIPIPDKVIVLIRSGHSPELFQQPGSTSTEEECYKFLTAIQAMFLSRSRPEVVV